MNNSSNEVYNDVVKNQQQNFNFAIRTKCIIAVTNVIIIFTVNNTLNNYLCSE